MNKWFWINIAVVIGIGTIVITGLLVAPKPPIPGPIKTQVTSTILVPGSKDIVTDSDSVKYASKEKLLSFNVTINGAKLVISEQPTPESFIDIPQVYDKVVAGMNEYEKFDTEVGTVHLTRPKELNGKQAAVLNTKGTLLFAKPDSNLSSDQWRQLFKAMEVVK